MLRYPGARLPATFAALLSVWAAPASAEVCFTCHTVACELVVETLSACQVVPSNHEIVVRATCSDLISIEALPFVRRASGEVVAGHWEPLSGYAVERFRFVGAEFPEGEELYLVGRAPRLCHMADVPSCATSSLQCVPDDLEPKDCCALYSEAALDQAETSDGQGGQGGQGGSVGMSPDEPIWLRFFASEADQTPPMTQQVRPICTGDAVSTRTLYWDAPGPFDDVQHVRFMAESEADAEALFILQSRTPCLREPGLDYLFSDGRLDFGVHTIRAEFRDWSGNLTLGPEYVLHVPEDCDDDPVGDRSFSCELPTYPFDQACLDSPTSVAEPEPVIEYPDLCSRFYGEGGSPDGLIDLDPIPLGDPTTPGAGGSSAADVPMPPTFWQRPSGCACATVGHAGRDGASWRALVAGLVLLFLGRRKRRPS